MSKYSNLDAHSRNCSSCIRQRDGGTGKKSSLPCRKLTESNVKIRRSTSSLSYSDLGDRKEEAFEGSTYITPTQRKNNEIRRLKAELSKANDIIQDRDKEIISLRNELVKHKGGLSPDYCEASSIPDSGNCDDVDCEQEPETRSALQNIDFELMESTLREEEETRLQLSTENQDLRTEQEVLEAQIQELRAHHEDEVQHLQETFTSEMERTKMKHNERVEVILGELADSALRYSRQQDVIEAKQSKLEELNNHIEILQSKIHQIQSDSASLGRTNSDLTQNLQRLTLDKENSRQSVHQDSHDNSIEVEKLAAKLEYSNSIISSLQAQIQQHRPEPSEPKYLSPSAADAAVQTITILKVDKVNQVDAWQDDLLVQPCQDQAAASLHDENDIKMTYQFLRRSIYYYLTDKDNKDYHLKSIERLLQFSEGEKQVIDQHKPLKKY